jgi:hypothetical protein
VDEVARVCKAALEAGHCPVIGLQSTGEARTAAFVAEHGGDDAEFDAFVEPAALVLSSFITKWLPEGLRGRQELLHRAEALKLPKNPLVGG